MTRLLLRAALLFAAVTIVAAFAIGATIELTEDQIDQMADPLRSRLIGIVREELNGLPVEERSARVAELSAQQPFDLRLSSEDEISPTDMATDWELDDEDNLFIVAEMTNDRRMVIAGPFDVPATLLWIDLFAAAAIIVGLASIAGLLLMAPIVKRLKEIQHTAHLIADGDLAARAPTGNKDAIDGLATEINRMAKALKNRFEDQRHLLQAISHETRTPAARMRFRTELLSKASNSEERNRHIDGLDQDLDDLEHLISELTFYVKVGRPTKPGIEQVDLLALIQDAVKLETPASKALEITLHPPEQPAYVSADPRHLRRVVDNLVSNARRYARSRLCLSWSPEGGDVHLIVSDDGPGIPSDMSDKVFDPFFRLEQGRERDNGGVGLGLAIAKRIVEQHGGSIGLIAGTGQGASFKIAWPRAPLEG